MAEIRMPKMGDGMEEGTINIWLKKEGDHVTSGEPLAEVETDKANVEISSYETGVLSKIVVAVGQTVPVGEVIAVIGEPAAKSGNANGTSLQGNGAVENRPVPVEAAMPRVESAAVPAGSSAPSSERVKASPLARKIAAESGVDIALVRGTGPSGRIVERDVQAFLKENGGRTAPTVELPQVTPVVPRSVVEPAPTVSASVPAAVPAGAVTEIKPSKMREAIARRTVLSKQTVPHFYVSMIIEMDRALALLKELNADATDGKVTVNDIIVKSCAIALGRVPEVNATWTPENTVRRFSEAHIGVAVGIDEGLIIPVVRNCERKTLREISREAKSLIGKARNGQLTPQEYSGGTFSVSNLGMMGVDEFIAIINPPEAAILAIGGVTRDVVPVGESEELVIKSRMKVAISADHRLLDGVVAAKFLQEVKKSLEAPFSLLS